MRPYDSKALVVDQPCDRCNAQPGEWCTRPSGANSPWQHAARYAAVQDMEKSRW